MNPSKNYPNFFFYSIFRMTRALRKAPRELLSSTTDDFVNACSQKFLLQNNTQLQPNRSTREKGESESERPLVLLNPILCLCLFERMAVLQSHRAEMLSIAMAVVAIGVGTAYYFYVTRKPKGPFFS